MQRMYPLKFILFALSVLLMSSATWGQINSKRLCSSQVPIQKGPDQQQPSVTVRSITMASGRESATIEMINESTKIITAYAFIADVAYIDGVHCKSEQMTDWATTVAAQEAGKHVNQELIKPGEVYRDVFRFNDPQDVVGLTVTMEVVVYLDQTAESTNQYILDRFIADRNDFAQAESLAAQAITAAMQDVHPLKSAHDRLLKMEHNDTATANSALLGTQQNLEPGNGRNFSTDEQERKYLAQQLADHRAYAVTFAKHAKIVGHQ